MQQRSFVVCLHAVKLQLPLRHAFKSHDLAFELCDADGKFFIKVGDGKLPSNKRIFPGTIVLTTAAGKFKTTDSSGCSIVYNIQDPQKTKVYFDEKVRTLKEVMDANKVTEVWSRGTAMHFVPDPALQKALQGLGFRLECLGSRVFMSDRSCKTPSSTSRAT